MLFVNKESMQALMQNVENSRGSQDEEADLIGRTSERLLKEVSRLFPQLYKPQSNKLLEIIMSKPDEDLRTCFLIK
jgi:hypothetical protein